MPAAAADADGDDDADKYEKSVVFRLSNKPDDATCFRAAYISFDEFNPDPVQLASMSVFKRCMGLQDFHLIVSSVNSSLRTARSWSFGVAVICLLLTFGCVALCILDVRVGVTVQVVVLLLQAGSQSLIRSWCRSRVTTLLDDHVNPQLVVRRRIRVVFRVVMTFTSQWCEIDFASVDGVNPLELRLADSAMETSAEVQHDDATSVGLSTKHDALAPQSAPRDQSVMERLDSSKLACDSSLFKSPSAVSWKQNRASGPQSEGINPAISTRVSSAV